MSIKMSREAHKGLTIIWLIVLAVIMLSVMIRGCNSYHSVLTR
jgi:hypothetical protein